MITKFLGVIEVSSYVGNPVSYGLKISEIETL